MKSSWEQRLDNLMPHAPGLGLSALVLAFVMCGGIVVNIPDFRTTYNRQAFVASLPSTEIVPVRKIVLKHESESTTIIVYSDGKTTCYLGQGISSCSEVP